MTPSLTCIFDAVWWAIDRLSDPLQAKMKFQMNICSTDMFMWCFLCYSWFYNPFWGTWWCDLTPSLTSISLLKVVIKIDLLSDPYKLKSELFLFYFILLYCAFLYLLRLIYSNVDIKNIFDTQSYFLVESGEISSFVWSHIANAYLLFFFFLAGLRGKFFTIFWYMQLGVMMLIHHFCYWMMNFIHALPSDLCCIYA